MLIEVYYGISHGLTEDENVIVVTAKDYLDKFDELSDAANGENGKVYPRFQNEPYNYYSEINDALWNIGCVENSESVFDMCGLDIETIIKRMEKHGFKLIHNEELDSNYD